MSRRSVHRPTTTTAPLVLITTITLTLILYTITAKTKTKTKPPPKLNTPSTIQSQPSVERTNGTDLIYQIPDSPKAALFLAHGCGGRAGNFWDRSYACPACVGLPEESRIVLSALHRGFAVLAVSSSHTCWTLGRERDAVKRIIEQWLDKNGLNKLPLAAMGASSGGYFVSALAVELRFSSIAIMIAEGVFENMNIPKGYPPTLFLHMPKDRDRTKAVEANMEALRQVGVSVKEVRCSEFALTPEFLSDRIPALDRNLSARLFDLFREEGFVDENGYMRKDGRRTPWREAAKRSGLLPLKFEWDVHVEEELNLAFGYHEMTSLPWDDALDWFEAHMS